ncbi:MAG TPA: TIGR02453 family protein, partial [Rhodocyclaceae bacterium]|nr:TIGR02453 family protein [Rhodocyclaceae bacterium]
MFDSACLDFLGELAANNDKIWFDANKARYESLVREPALAFVAAMAPQLAQFAPQFRADARKMGGSLMRVFRDTRFSRDKTPYKTNIGIQFR